MMPLAPPLDIPSISNSQLNPIDDGLTPQEAPLLHETNLGKSILDLISEFERVEEHVRFRNSLKWRKHIHYWNSVQYLVESLVAHDWMTPEDILAKDPQSDIDPALYAKVVNVYKANGEIFIGALTSGTPTVRFFPKDADDEDDVTTAKAYSKISELIQRFNKARMLLMKSLFILYNQGMVACYNENKADYRFGRIEEAQYEDITGIERQDYCPTCGTDLGSQPVESSIAPPSPPTMCPTCEMPVQPESEDMEVTTPQQTGVTYKPKTRECLEVYGPLNVKVPMWVRDQQSTPYLILETEESIYMMRAIYPEIADRIDPYTYSDTAETERRIPTQYNGELPQDRCNVKRCWLRPWSYTYYVKDEAKFQELNDNYPEGLYAVIINNSLLAEIVDDKLDEHWTLTEHPLAETVHAEPIGTPMVPLQDMVNELSNITLETIEFGIGELFADTRVLDFESYQTQEARPGQITPAASPAGQPLGNGFFEVKPATLSREVELFADRLQNTTQFVMGTYPSVYGGAQEGGGGTAREYELSKASALQRLSTTWIILQDWWANVMGKAARSFAENMMEDEKFVTPRGSSFLNVWIRRVELTGEVGDILPEIAEAIPVSWSQKRDIVMNLIQMQNEDIATVMRHPENASLIASTIGLAELYIPGDDDRNKQLSEIQELIKMAPMSGLDGQMIPSVQVDPDVDNHAVEAEVCRSWLKSDVGLDAKKTNPPGYANVLAHLKMHLFFSAQQQQAAMEQERESEDVGEVGKDNE